MAGFLSRLFGKSQTPDPIVEIEPLPLSVPSPIAAIGDIHGCATLASKLVATLHTDHPNTQLLFVGDYIDRGEESRQVIEMLMEMREATCLMGNHERMCLDFLDAPEERGARWLRNGGLQTIASYGVSGTQTEMTKMRDALALAMGDTVINWLANRPLYAKFGTLYAIHAGADPARPIEEQGEKPLIWGHPQFRKQPRLDGQWVVHGHTIVDQPTIEGSRVSIDTGAYATGRLTAAIFSEGDVEFTQSQQ
ncbi:metallophosphoesterase family protein [Celeribacter sp.]|uniref:metallophosphoesterase family protein n=1 Tax=Celeribacter sp. TaxID=1890673 RepID=UPI003A90C576